eukprot:3589543-Pleurochrysis_carterae.AAC.1
MAMRVWRQQGEPVPHVLAAGRRLARRWRRADQVQAEPKGCSRSHLAGEPAFLAVPTHLTNPRTYLITRAHAPHGNRPVPELRPHAIRATSKWCTSRALRCLEAAAVGLSRSQQLSVPAPRR